MNSTALLSGKGHLQRILAALRRFATVWGGFPLIAPILVIFIFEAYVLLVQREGDSALPPLFGNFQEIRATLNDAPRKQEFRFGVVGDTRSVGVFERISRELHQSELDFAVILGDFSYAGTESAHAYFRAESAKEYVLPFPVFLIAGNHDLDPKQLAIPRFEELYGPSIFSFEYQDCLFIALRVIGETPSDQASLDFLKSFLIKETANYRKIFVFMHIPPPVPTYARKFRGPHEFISLFRRLKVNYVFAAHYHGYARTQCGDTTYLVSGGGGAPLDRKSVTQFHHAIVVRVGKNYVSERIIPVAEGDDLEDKLERLAITHVYPWMSQNPITICTPNIGLLVALIGIGKPFCKRLRKRWRP